jgi:transposase
LSPDNTILIRFLKGIGIMRKSLFWLSDEQWARIGPHLPTDVRGVERKDDRRVISGIVHVLKSGCRWSDCPPEYGPHTTIYNRFARWAERGIWENLFRTIARSQNASSIELNPPNAYSATRRTTATNCAMSWSSVEPNQSFPTAATASNGSASASASTGCVGVSRARSTG